jgi:pimeloyl-ACP methyl ester carboxylesterase
VYNDADLVIGTGYSDGVNPVTAGLLVSKVRPASMDPRTADQSWAQDPGYLEPLPGVRGISQFYHRANADPAVIALDEKLANTVTAQELSTFTQSEFDGSRRNIHIPTFLINGEFDNLVCGNNTEHCATTAGVHDGPAQLERDGYRLRDWQGPLMSARSCFRAAVIPEAGHDINLHRNAHQLYATIAYFADQAMGPRGDNAATYRASCGTTGSPVAELLPDANAPGLTPPPDLFPRSASRGHSNRATS